MSWVDIDEKIPDVIAGKFKVRLKNGDERDAFFYEDAIGWISFYGQKTSHWWNADYAHERIDDITHWKTLNKRLE